jgi:chromate transporter
MFGAGIAVMLLMNLSRVKRMGQHGLFSLGPALFAAHQNQKAALINSHWAGFAAAGLPYSLPLLFLTFLKIGSVLYGSGYVLLAFLRADFVVRLGWLSEEQLINALAIGQVTPGPVFTTATFIGYVVGGFPGAVAATIGIFLPAFFFVWLSNPFIPRLRRSPWAGALLDGVNVASLGLMAVVAAQLGFNALVDPVTFLIGLTSVLLLFWRNTNPTWLVLGGGAVGLLRYFL